MSPSATPPPTLLRWSKPFSPLQLPLILPLPTRSTWAIPQLHGRAPFHPRREMDQEQGVSLQTQAEVGHSQTLCLAI